LDLETACPVLEQSKAVCVLTLQSIEFNIYTTSLKLNNSTVYLRVLCGSEN